MRFNALFAYHRALLILGIFFLFMLLLSRLYGVAKAWDPAAVAVASLATALVIVLIWHRLKQRAYYYVAEVLQTAEQIIEARTTRGRIV